MKRNKIMFERMKRLWDHYSPSILQVLHKINSRFSNFWRRKHLTQILLLLVLIGILCTIIFFAFTAWNANVESLQEGLSQSTVIYDKDDNVASTVDTNRTDGINISDLPDYIPNAVIAIEDRRFKEHNGFDIKGMARAFFNNLFSGRITGGGSTITQQLTKNALLSPEQTYRRKIEELFLAVEIEKNYSKDEILSMYLNQVYFGSGAWGIDQAAKKYFNKDINSVTISEAAMLAGLLQSPSALDPYKHYERSIERRNIVLASMKELKMISKDEYLKAKNENIKLEDGGGSYIDRDHPYYVDAVLNEAISKYGLTQEEIITRGYRIYTEMDQNIQSQIEKVYEKGYLFPSDKAGVPVQSGTVFLDPQTGGVLGIVGGRGEPVFRGFNRATQLKVQPGSALKPLAVYTPALEEGYKATSVLKDEKMTFGDYSPENYSHTFQGQVPMYEAVAKSLNVPAVWLLNEIGLNKGINSLGKFGIPLEKEDHYLGIALGGMSKGVSPLQMAEAYSVFANSGKREEGHLITKIVGPTGNVIAKYKKQTTKVTSKKVANEMTSMLLGVVENGTGKGTYISDLPIAGKTGSTQLPYQDINGTKDQWFVGYTPTIVGAIWLGFDKTDREHYLSTSSSESAVPIFKNIMVNIKPYIEISEFQTSSVENELTGEKKNKVLLEDQTDIFKEKIEKKAPRIKETIKDDATVWFEKVNSGLEKAKEKGKQLMEQFNSLTK